MSDRDQQPVTPPDGQRVLEIGEERLFHLTLPDQTDSLFASYRADLSYGRLFLGLRTLIQAYRRAWRGDYDLIVLGPPFYPGWHPRSFLAAFKFSIFRGQPKKLPGALLSPLFFALLRFVPLPPVIAIEKSDSFGSPAHHHFLLDKAVCFYKRELPVDHWRVFFASGHRRLPGFNFRMKQRWQKRVSRLRPVGLGISPHKAEIAASVFGATKKTDVFFAGGIPGNSTVRQQVPLQIKALREAGFSVDFPEERVSLPDYMRRCAQSWVTLSPEGLGWDCFRHIEAAIAGSVPLVSTPTITRYKPMIVGTHCLSYIPDENRIVDIVREALADKDKLTEMAKAGHEHALKYLTKEAIARELLRVHGGMSKPSE